MLITKNGTVRIEDGTGYHVGTLNHWQGRWRRLATVSDQKDLIQALPGWISQVQAEERSIGVPSHQLWQGIRAAFNADGIVGCCPLTAPACFKAAGHCEDTGGDTTRLRRARSTIYALPAA